MRMFHHVFCLCYLQRCFEPKAIESSSQDLPTQNSSKEDEKPPETTPTEATPTEATPTEEEPDKETTPTSDGEGVRSESGKELTDGAPLTTITETTPTSEVRLKLKTNFHFLYLIINRKWAESTLPLMML